MHSYTWPETFSTDTALSDQLPNPASVPGEAGIALSAVALVLVMIGPVVRLPLRRTATLGTNVPEAHRALRW